VNLQVLSHWQVAGQAARSDAVMGTVPSCDAVPGRHHFKLHVTLTPTRYCTKPGPEAITQAGTVTARLGDGTGPATSPSTEFLRPARLVRLPQLPAGRAGPR